MSLKVFIIAGELSGDRLGGALMAGLQSLTDVEFEGIGGPLMGVQGLDSLFGMDELSVMGLIEVLPKIPILLRRVKETAAALDRFQPDVVVTIDSPDFCFRVVKKARISNPDFKVVHYVAPSVWAWRPERADKMAQYVNHVLALLPFEPPYMEAAGMSCDFVGHPVIAEPKVKPSEIKAIRREVEADDDRLITILPGSRKSEIARMGPIYAQVVRDLHNQRKDLRFAIAAAPSVEAEVMQLAQDWPETRVIGMEGDVPKWEARKRALYAASDLAIATSGTVALELAAQNCPMVIAYKANWMTTRMVKKMALIDTANLVNILTETRVVPELLFEAATPENIKNAALDVMRNKSKQSAMLTKSMKLLGKGKKGADLWAARSVLRFLEIEGRK